MKFELVKETAVEKTYTLEGRVLQPGLITKVLYGATVGSTASAFLAPAFLTGSFTFGLMGLMATYATSRTMKECLEVEVDENRDRFKRKNRKSIAKDGTRELVNNYYRLSKGDRWTTGEPFESSHEVKLFAFREDGKLQFEKVITELPHTTWQHAFQQLIKEDQIILDENPHPGIDWKERKKELGMLPTEVYYRSNA